MKDYELKSTMAISHNYSLNELDFIKITILMMSFLYYVYIEDILKSH